MYLVYQNQGQGPIMLRFTSLDRFYNSPLTVWWWIVYTRIRTKSPYLLELNPLIGFTVCHWWKFFITDFSKIMKAIKLNLGAHMDSGLMYYVYRNQGQWPITHGVKSLDRFYVAMLLCPTVMLSGKNECKIFQHCGYFLLIVLQQGYCQILLQL